MWKRWKVYSILFCACLAGACGNEEFQHVDIYFTADTLGGYASRLEPHVNNREVGGYAILKNFLQSLEGPYLLFDGGNWFGATAEAPLTKGSFVTPFLKEIPYTAAVLSPNDFSYGWPTLRGLLRDLPYPFVAANLRLENSIPWPLHDYQIRTVGNIKIGIFGLANLPQVHGKDVRLPGMRAEDPVQIAQKMSALLHEKQVDYVILLSSLGLQQEKENNDTVLAQEVEGINLILQSNQDREQFETEKINQTFLVYPGSHLDSIAHIRISFDKNKKVLNTSFNDILLAKDTYGENNALSVRASSLRRETANKMKQKVTSTVEEIPNYLDKESPLGILLAQCLHKWAKLDGAILNAASIRQSLPKGDIMEYDVYKMYPYGDNITLLTLKGSVLLKALQMSVNTEDNFPQVAGMDVKYTQLDSGKLIQRVVLGNGRIVRPNDTYRIAVTDHILAGGFGHDEFINSLEFKNTFVDARQIMRACLLRQKQIAAPIYHHFQEIK